MKESDSLSLMQARELMSFAVAARHLNFARAAREIGCTPSVLSRRIAALEARVGGPLFMRSTRRVALTALGESLLAHSGRLESAIAEINAELHGQSIEPAGVVRLHVPSTYGRRCVSPLIPQLLAEHPRLRLDVTFDDDYVDLISARIDIALRIGSFDDSGLIGTGLRPIRRLLCASPLYLKGAPRLDHPEDLQLHRCLAFQGLRTGDTWLLMRNAKQAAVRIRPVLRANSAAALRDAVLAGSGVALLADFVVGDAIADGRLMEVLHGWSPVQPQVKLLWVAGADRSRSVRAVIDFLRRKLG
ncbi:LysR family transcriptional regulator [Steroidobacter agaridevorans]|uniref:LysR family transcriptional regulator n=2 Tax=Steroidobacter agaridevorans TaxID=2695856 RepID=A0A829YL89_9GAMM|nr:LysR family transcriptional regulator [Steroidobacter agaridevorans]